ncbi:MAG: hypothetical protein Kow0068_09490 [Marinilabiliales bacterium]
MDSLINRINRDYFNKIDSIYSVNGLTYNTALKTAICPHDDYSYAGYLYPLIAKKIKAKTVIIFGVCHKASKFNLSNQLIFDSFDKWKTPAGFVNVSESRNKIISLLPKETYQIHNEMHILEHSVEAIIPFLQYYNPDVEIIPIIVPYMDLETMKRISSLLAGAISEVFKGQQWGSDFAIVISSDAVHYGTEDWGGSNFAFLGDGKEGYKKAVSKENDIIEKYFKGVITSGKIEGFFNTTVDSTDLKKYLWTWCGRFSIPFGLYTSMYLQNYTQTILKSCMTEYSTSIEHKPVKVDDIGMGVTAPAKINHWVGYAAVGYE